MLQQLDPCSDNAHDDNPDTTPPNATPLSAPILYVINEEDPGPAYNGNCFDNNFDEPVFPSPEPHRARLPVRNE